MDRKMVYNTAQIISNEGKLVEDGVVFPAVITKEGIQNGFKKEWPELQKSAWTANNRPVVLNHPDSGPVTDLKEVMGYLSDISLDEEKKEVKALVHVFSENKGLITMIKNKEITDVSIGFWARMEYNEDKEADFEGWERDILIDHLALLQKGTKGACSTEDGCGIEPVTLNLTASPDNLTFPVNGYIGDIPIVVNYAGEEKPEMVHDRAIPFKDGPAAPEDTPWNFNAADYTIEQLKNACAWMADKPADELTKGDFKLPYKTPDGKIVLRGVMAAGNAIQGARGGVDIPEKDIPAVKAVLEKAYAKFDRKAPWQKQDESDMEEMNMEEIENLKNEIAQRDEQIKALSEEIERYKEEEKKREVEKVENLKNEIRNRTVISEDELNTLDSREKLEAFLFALNKYSETKNEEKNDEDEHPLTFEEIRKKLRERRE